MTPARLLLGGIAFLCVWTLGGHAVALGRLPFLLMYPVLALATAAAIVAWRQRALVESIFAGFPPLAADWPRLSTPPWRSTGVRIGLAAVALVALASVAVQYKYSFFLPFWLLCIALGVAALVFGPKGSAEAVTPSGAAPVAPASGPGGIAALAVFLGLTLFYFLTSVPDSDDTLYVGFAVSAKGSPALFAFDQMLGADGLAFAKSTYRLETYPLLAAIISEMSGIATMTAAHAIVPVPMLAMTACVLIVLHAGLFGRRWPLGVALHCVALLAIDGSLQSYGYHGITRYFQGKGPFFTAMVPLIAFLTVLCVRGQGRGGFAALAAVQVISIGMTANALFVGPIASVLVAAPLLLLGSPRERLRCLALGLTVLYPAALSIGLLAFDPPSPSQIQEVGPVGEVFWGAMGSPYGHLCALGLMLAAVAAPAMSRALRPVAVYALALLLLILDPFLWEPLGRYVTGNVNSRLLLAVPLPFVIAIIGTVTINRSGRLIGAGLLGVAILALALPGSMLRTARFEVSPTKLPALDYDAARTLNAQGDGRLLAPEVISQWIPTLEGPRPVILARRIDYVQRRAQFRPATYDARLRLFDWINGKIAPYADLQADLDALCVETIALDQAEVEARGIGGILDVAGFSTSRAGSYRLWTRENSDCRALPDSP
jgi:hypothetical protein